MIEFRLAKHDRRPVQVVEVWVNGLFRACLYPQEPNTVKLISTHMVGDPQPGPDGPDAWCFVFHDS